MKRALQPISMAGFLALIVYSCANIVAPTGGPRDEDPPVVLRSTPPNFSTNYQGEDVRIFFDEFVELRNIRQNLLVSPPLANDPDFRLRGRSIIMTLNDDTLQTNTTYNFFFGESIVDITEANPIPNFQFVVSTGDYVDSLSLRGRVVDAKTLKPSEDVFVMMYDNIYDSVPMLERPVYLSKTNKEGNFTINNMREGEYLLFALLDMNANFLYDNPNEKIAFYDSLVRPIYVGSQLISDTLNHEKSDTISATNQEEPLQEIGLSDQPVNDSSTALSDTMLSDTVQPHHRDLDIPFYELFLFQEEDTVQAVVSATMVARGKVNIVFRIPASQVEIRDYTEPFDQPWYIPEFNTTKDTLSLWLPDMQRDSLSLEIRSKNQIIDSVTVSLVQRPTRGRQRETDTPAEDVFLSVSAPTIVGRNTHPYFKKFELKSETPIRSFDVSQFRFYSNDSIPEDMSFRFVDSLQRKIEMESFVFPDTNYRLFIPPGSITDIFGVQNDTLSFSFAVDNEESYGYIIINLTLPDQTMNARSADILQNGEESNQHTDGLFSEETEKQENGLMEETHINDPTPGDALEIAATEPLSQQYILQLLDNELSRVLQEKIITSDGEYRFNHLAASTYRLRIIIDENHNDRWDTGHYLSKRQPERVFIYPETVQTRLNWEIEVIWDTNEH